MALEARLSNWTRNGRKFLNSGKKLLPDDLLDWLQNIMCLEEQYFRLNEKARSRLNTYPNFVTV